MNTLICEMPEIDVSSAWMISAMRWMFVCVSVRMMALELSLEEIVALAGEQRAQVVHELAHFRVAHGQDLRDEVVLARDVGGIAADVDRHVAASWARPGGRRS